MRLLLQKTLGGNLTPVDEAGTDALRRLKRGPFVMAEITQPRNLQFHRLWRALASITWDNVDHEEYPSVEDLIARIKIGVGHRDRLVFEGGIVAFIPRSLSFAKCSEQEFTEFFDKATDWIIQNILPGVTREDMRAEIETMTGIRER